MYNCTFISDSMFQFNLTLLPSNSVVHLFGTMHYTVLECSCCGIHRYVGAPPSSWVRPCSCCRWPWPLCRMPSSGCISPSTESTPPRYRAVMCLFQINAKKFLKNLFRRSSQSETLLLQIFANETFLQCCGSGSGIRCLFDPLDLGSGMGKN